MTPIDGFDLNQVLSGLKDFQRDTVEYVFQRMYVDADKTPRFLCADEVGLGKTLVARGVIAKAIDHLQRQGVQRIDIVYVCSNSSIARQNINKLNVTGKTNFEMPSRLTLLPTKVQNLQQNPVNFISFTPGTAFEVVNGAGRSDERIVLYHMLPKEWKRRRIGALNVLRGECTFQSFSNQLQVFRETIDQDIHRRFVSALEQVPGDLFGRFKALARDLDAENSELSDKQRWHQRRIIGALRQVLARTCIDALEPDLIILDEFQRFRDLLDRENLSDTNALAQALFSYSNEGTHAHVLLLSATPYKMYTTNGDLVDDHYQDFLKTIEFLHQDAARTNQLKDQVDSFRKLMMRIGTPQVNIEQLGTVRDEIQHALSRVMVRTEKLAATADRNGMLKEIGIPPLRLEKSDVIHYAMLRELAKLWEQDEPVEYWKSGPYLLNFMEDYKLKLRLKETAKTRLNRDTRQAIVRGQEREFWFPWNAFERYEPVPPANARLQFMLDELIKSGAWKLLWIPPSLAYYRLEGPFAQASTFTKRLIFSSWKVVPKTLATMLSYAAEQQMFIAYSEYAFNNPEYRKALSRGIPLSAPGGEPANMAAFTLLYPSPVLVDLCDPQAITLELSQERSEIPRLEEVIARATVIIDELLKDLAWPETEGTKVDPNWYWAAPLLLDRHVSGNFLENFPERQLASFWQQAQEQQDEDEEQVSVAWLSHVAKLRQVLEDGLTLGAKPPDLSRMLALLAISSPANTTFRALIDYAVDDNGIVDAWVGAASVAWAFRSTFNQPEKAALLRGLAKQAGNHSDDMLYWQAVLQYCAEGCLQAVLDEYAYMLNDELGLGAQNKDSKIQKIAEAITKAINLQTASLGVDDIKAEGQRLNISPRTIRSHIAVRFATDKTEEEQGAKRIDRVRTSFNSPFWPFVLITTSVGQEGLDFHHYCHAVVHWNLPSNPVDLEQREGRVHRYKGHVIRKNLAHRFGAEILREPTSAGDKPMWERLFGLGVKNRSESATDLEPFWIFPGEYNIERYVPILPMSREVERAAQLKRSLMIYRLVFGQPRQEDLVEFLLKRVPPADLDAIMQDLQIQLTPPKVAVLVRKLI